MYYILDVYIYIYIMYKQTVNGVENVLQFQRLNNSCVKDRILITIVLIISIPLYRFTNVYKNNLTIVYSCVG